MPPEQVSLSQPWAIGEEIGDPGGFGSVFEASNGAVSAAAKFIPKAPGAERELLFVELGPARNVIPILDHGEHEDQWVLVMPRAEKSLRQHIKQSGTLDIAEASSILIDVATALESLEDEVVHRDVKPENILLEGGAWCLADFGISRYAEATTDEATRKFSLTPPYAAPEQWRGERATSATDIYALGVVAFELVAGVRPFSGPGDDFRNQHLHEEPDFPPDFPSGFASLIDECLIKSPGARPSASTFRTRLGQMDFSDASDGLLALQEANRAQVAERAEKEREASLARTEADRRSELVDAGVKLLIKVSDELRDVIQSVAPESEPTSGVYGDRPDWSLRLGGAELSVSQVDIDSPGTTSVFDVVAHASIALTVPPGTQDYRGRAHSLWFCDAVNEGEYAWYETAFMSSPLTNTRDSTAPFALTPSNGDSSLQPAMGTVQVAWPFTRLDPGDVSEFVDRWAGWLGQAAQGTLRYPMSMPERRPEGSWRR
jgi:eukaryotic-like serine/threonine-protein kinase